MKVFKIGYDKKITMVQGDTGVIRMRISNYELSQGDEVRFAIANKANPSILLCQHSDKKIVLEKQVTVFEKDGSARIVIYPYDTEYLQPGKYLYEIQVKTKDGRVDTVVPLTSFTMMDGSIQGEYGQTTPSKPEPTPSEIELRFKRIENEIIPELGTRITNVENEIDSIRPSLDKSTNKINDNIFSIGLGSYLRKNNNDFETSLEQAIGDLPTTGGRISFPLGYNAKMTRTITINKPNVVFERSSNYYETTISTDTPNLTMFNLLNYGICFKGINIIGDGLGEYGEGATTIPFVIGDGLKHNLDEIKIENCTISRFDKIVIKTRNFTIKDNLFSYCLNGLDIQGVTSTSQADRRDYKIVGNRFHVSNKTINFNGNVAHSEVHCSNNIIDRCNYGITGCIDDSSIIDNDIILCKNDGIMCIASGKAINHVGNKIQGNTVTGFAGEGLNDGYGIYNEVQKTSISDNMIKKKGKDGICNKGSYSHITGNNVRGCDFKSQNLYSGINVAASYCFIDGNTSIVTDEVCTQQYGLYIDGQGNQIGINKLSGKVAQTNNTPTNTTGITGEGLSRALRFGASKPSDTEGQRGDYVINKIPTELGIEGQRYIIHGWQKVQDYTGATSWQEVRTLTGR